MGSAFLPVAPSCLLCTFSPGCWPGVQGRLGGLGFVLRPGAGSPNTTFSAGLISGAALTCALIVLLLAKTFTLLS